MHEKLLKLGRVVFELRERTDRQTYLSQYFAPLPGGEGQCNESQPDSIEKLAYLRASLLGARLVFVR